MKFTFYCINLMDIIHVIGGKKGVIGIKLTPSMWHFIIVHDRIFVYLWVIIPRMGVGLFYYQLFIIITTERLIFNHFVLFAYVIARLSLLCKYKIFIHHIKLHEFLDRKSRMYQNKKVLYFKNRSVLNTTYYHSETII